MTMVMGAAVADSSAPGSRANPPGRPTVLLVDDHGLLAQGLTWALRAEGVDLVTATVPNVADLVEVVRTHHPALALVDLQFGSAAFDGLDLIGPLTDAGTVVLVLTGVTDPAVLGRCLEAGAAGVARKSDSFDQLLLNIDAALRGSRINGLNERAQLLTAARDRRLHEERRKAPFAALSVREAQVLDDLVHGYTAEVIAEKTFVSIATVRTQIQAILRKLDVRTQLGAVALARDADWTLQL